LEHSSSVFQILESWAQSNVFSQSQLRNALNHVKGVLRRREEEAAAEKSQRRDAKHRSRREKEKYADSRVVFPQCSNFD
jgi:hypothetical protein